MSSIKLLGNKSLYEILGVRNDASIQEGNKESIVI